MASGIMVKRTWLRDGSSNVMPLAAAAANLQRKMAPDSTLQIKHYRGTVREIEEALVDGVQLWTRLAVFRIV